MTDFTKESELKFTIISNHQEANAAGGPACLIFGGLVMDCYYHVDCWPERSQDGFIESEELMVGGCAINMAATVKNLGGIPYIVSGVGGDQTGNGLKAYMKEVGLPLDFIAEVPGLSGKCMVFLEPDGERTFLTSKGAEGKYPESLKERILAAAKRGKSGQGPAFSAAAVTGYYLLNKDSGRMVETLEALHEMGVKVIFDPSPLVSYVDRDLLERVLKISCLITPNSSEREAIEKVISIEDFCAGGGMAVVKTGSEGGSVFLRDRTFDYKAERVEAVDTTGAGDSFAGALTMAIMNGLEPEEAVGLAARCAAVTVQIAGPHGFWKLEE